MKKGLSALLILLGIATPVSYYIMGMRSESVLKKTVVDANVALMQALSAQQSPLDVNLKLANYKNGVLSSSANLDVSMKVNMPVNLNRSKTPGTMPPMGLPAFTYSIPMTIYHGPFILQEQKVGLSYATAQLEIPENYKKMVTQFVSPESILPTIEFSVFTDFDAKSKIKVEVPPFNLDAKMMQTKLDFLGVESHWKTDAKFSYIKGDSVMSGFVANQQDKKVNVGEMKVEYDLHASYPGMWLGSMNANLPKVEFSQGGRNMVSFEGGSMKSNSYENEGLFSGMAYMAINKVKVMDKTFGPGVFDMSMENFDLKLMSELQAKANQLNASGLNRQNQQKALNDLMLESLKLAKTGPSIEIKKLSFTLPEGTSSLTAVASVPKDTNVTTPEALVKAITAESTLTAPKVLVRKMAIKTVAKKLRKQQYMRQLKQRQSDSQVDNTNLSSAVEEAPILTRKEIKAKAKAQVDRQLASLLKAGLISEEGDNYKVKLLFKGGELTINGHPFSSNLLMRP